MSARPAKVMCTKCGSTDAHPSRRRSPIRDAIMRMAGQRAYRCHACRNRFYARDPEVESEVSGAGQAAAPALDERKDAGPQAADRTLTSAPGHEFLKDWPTGPAVSRTQAGGRPMDPAKSEEPCEVPIQAGGEMGPGAVTAVEPAMDAGDGEGRRGAPPAPVRPEGEEGEIAPGEALSVQELLSRVDRIIESARTQKGPDAPVAATQDASSAGSPRKALLNRVTRALRSIWKRPSEEDRRRIIVR